MMLMILMMMGRIKTKHFLIETESDLKSGTNAEEAGTDYSEGEERKERKDGEDEKDAEGASDYILRPWCYICNKWPYGCCRPTPRFPYPRPVLVPVPVGAG